MPTALVTGASQPPPTGRTRQPAGCGEDQRRTAGDAPDDPPPIAPRHLDAHRAPWSVSQVCYRYPLQHDQTTQAHCHSLVVNACVLSTTGYLQDAIDAQRAAGHPVSDDAISRLSPGHYEPINPYGTLNLNVADMLEHPRRPLRKTSNPR